MEHNISFGEFICGLDWVQDTFEKYKSFVELLNMFDASSPILE
jgi:hypothetical protein